jgi:hypothetical protein
MVPAEPVKREGGAEGVVVAGGPVSGAAAGPGLGGSVVEWAMAVRPRRGKWPQPRSRCRCSRDVRA